VVNLKLLMALFQVTSKNYGSQRASPCAWYPTDGLLLDAIVLFWDETLQVR
jgi:hypothetical protein